MRQDFTSRPEEMSGLAKRGQNDGEGTSEAELVVLQVELR
jgi:hypothetical protein